MPTRNAPLFNLIADVIELDPNLHDQQTWATNDTECGTTACIAGWACILGTDYFKFKGGRWQPKKSLLRQQGLDPWWEEDPMEYLASHDQGFFSSTAGALLGLGGFEQDVLFAGDRGPLDGLTVPEALREIARGRDICAVWGYAVVDEGRGNEDHDETEGWCPHA